MAISALTRLGLTKEATYGDGGAPTLMIPSEPPDISEVYEQILDQGLRGYPAVDYAAIQGASHIEADINGVIYPDIVGWLLYGIMGDASFDDSGTPNVHTFKAGNDPPSYALQDENQVQTYRYTGMRLSEFSFSFDAAEGLTEYSASFMGQSMEKITGDAIPTDEPDAPMKGCDIVVTIGGDTPRVMSGEVTLAREHAMVFSGNGDCSPTASYSGPLEVTGSLTLDFHTDDDYDRYRDKDQEEVIINIQRGVEGDTDYRSMKLQMSNTDFGDDPVELDRSGVHVTMDYSIRALFNLTDDGPCLFELENEEDDYAA